MLRRPLAILAAATGALAALLIIPAMAAGGGLVFDRGLPTSNLNNTAGGDRSNVAWAFGDGWITGDDFTVGAAGETWVVTGVRTWSVGGSPTDANALGYEIGDRFDTVTLYGASASTNGLNVLTTGSLNADSNVNSNPNITHAPVQYVGAAHYQGSSGADIRMWQNDFNNLAWVIDGGMKYNFAVDGTLRIGVIYYWFNHASNAALGGSNAEGADDEYLAWDLSDLGAGAYACDSDGPVNPVTCGGWDKSSDINVQVFASKVATDGGQCKNGVLKKCVILH